MSYVFSAKPERTRLFVKHVARGLSGVDITAQQHTFWQTVIVHSLPCCHLGLFALQCNVGYVVLKCSKAWIIVARWLCAGASVSDSALIWLQLTCTIGVLAAPLHLSSDTMAVGQQSDCAYFVCSLSNF